LHNESDDWETYQAITDLFFWGGEEERKGANFNPVLNEENQ